jgi:predicted nucleic acid-binding protein
VKLYADEPDHGRIRALNVMVVSTLARVEVPAALWRKARIGELDNEAAGRLVSAFEHDYHGDREVSPRFAIVSANERVLAAAAREVAHHGLRAYDAMQLASALAVRDTDPGCDAFACFDNEVRRAASRAGFSLVPEAA